MNGRSFPMMVILPVSGEVEKNVPTLAIASYSRCNAV